MSSIPSSNRILTRKLGEQARIDRQAARACIAEATETILRSKQAIALAEDAIAHAREVLKRAE